MIAGARINDKAFKRALTVSAAAHLFLFIVILVNPSLPKKASPKGVIHYFGMGAIGGGGGNGRPAGGGQTAQAAAAVKTEAPKPAPAKKDMLRDLAVPDKVKPKVESKLHYPTEAKTKRKQPPEKKAAISKPEAGAKTEPEAEKAAPAGLTGESSGMLIAPGGTGEGTGTGEGGGLGGFGDGLADFPYAYYLNRIQDEIRVNWFPSRIDPGPGVILQTVIYFRIYGNGTISTIQVKQSSGIPNFDLIAQRAVANAAPFPPLPREYDGEYLGINLLFEHKR